MIKIETCKRDFSSLDRWTLFFQNDNASFATFVVFKYSTTIQSWRFIELTMYSKRVFLFISLHRYALNGVVKKVQPKSKSRIIFSASCLLLTNGDSMTVIYDHDYALNYGWSGKTPKILLFTTDVESFPDGNMNFTSIIECHRVFVPHTRKNDTYTTVGSQIFINVAIPSRFNIQNTNRTKI